VESIQGGGTMTLTRYRDDAPVDYMVLADDGEWVPASEALELQTQNARLRGLLSRCATVLEAVPDPSARELALIDEAKRG
jgi:hypothetical protein